MDNKFSVAKVLPVLFGFFVMGFCDIVGISSDYAASAFGWSATMAGLIPSVVFIWFFLLGIGNAILQVSVNPLLQNVVTDERLLTSSLTAGQVVKAISSFVGPFIVLAAVNWLGGGDEEKWYYCFPIMGAITLVSGLWLWLTPIPREKRRGEREERRENPFKLLGDKTILLLFIGGIGFCCSCVFPIVYGLALKRRPEKANEISGLMIMAVAGGTVSFLVGAANDWSGITGGALVIALEIVYLTYCAYFVKP